MTRPLGRAARFLSLALLVVTSLLVAACDGAASAPPVSYPPGAVVVVSEGRKFVPQQVLIPADEAFTFVLDNKDSELHNLAVRTEQGFEGDVVFRHDPIGKEVGVFEVPAIAAGTYFLICEVHPEMTGTVVAQ